MGKGARLSSWSGVCCHREADLGGACASTEGVMPNRQWLLTFCCLGSGCCQGTPKKEDLYTVSHEVKFSFANLGKITSREHLESIKSLRDLCAKQSQRALHLFCFFPYEILTAFCTAEYTPTSARDVLRVTQLMRADHLWTYQKRPQEVDTELLP